MEEQPGFVVQVSQNRYLSADDREVHAVLTVTADGIATAAPERGPQAAEVIAIDCSGSMGHPATKIIAARQATQAAIDALRDGVPFAVIAGTETAAMVYPAAERLVPATDRTRREAKRKVRGLYPSGGTSMGAWLRLAERLLDGHPAAVRHAMLLTDGRNLPQYRLDLDEALASCQGKFVCDGRGIGDDYAPEELLRIAHTLRGSADAIVDDHDLVAHFRDMMRTAMGKVVGDVWLRLRTMPFTRLRSLRQVFPTEIDLTPSATPIDERMRGFTTGSWADGEEREFHVCLEVDSSGLPRNEDVQAARVDVAFAGPGTTEMRPHGRPAPILLHLTADLRLSSAIHPKVAHYRGYTELAAAVDAGREAFEAHDLDLAAREWGRAVRLAAGFGDAELLRRLGRLVEIAGDPAEGRARVRASLRPRDIAAALIGSRTTTRGPGVPPRRDRPADPDAPDIVCPHCGGRSAPTARFCEECRRPLGERG